jgi:CheY-like chemotaxis protein
MCKILIVEDNEYHRELAREMITSAGHQATEAENGEAAMQWLRDHPTDLPCIVLVDLMMPVMDGWDFVAALRANPKWARICVVILSVRVRKDEAPPVLRANAYWPKPPTAEQLAKIERWCPWHYQA